MAHSFDPKTVPFRFIFRANDEWPPETDTEETVEDAMAYFGLMQDHEGGPIKAATGKKHLHFLARDL